MKKAAKLTVWLLINIHAICSQVSAHYELCGWKLYPLFQQIYKYISWSVLLPNPKWPEQFSTERKMRCKLARREINLSKSFECLPGIGPVHFQHFSHSLRMQYVNLSLSLLLNVYYVSGSFRTGSFQAWIFSARMAWRELWKLFTLKNRKAIGTRTHTQAPWWKNGKHARDGEVKDIFNWSTVQNAEIATGNKKQFITHKFIIYSDVISGVGFITPTLLSIVVIIFYHPPFYVRFYFRSMFVGLIWCRDF